jgi:hypothetical protein
MAHHCDRTQQQSSWIRQILNKCNQLTKTSYIPFVSKEVMLKRNTELQVVDTSGSQSVRLAGKK